ncbi:MAG: glycosyltransferase [Candidatus Woesearchaeota archaeon]
MLSIIIPTYNEKESIINTINQIKSNIKGIRHEIIVVDDNSPDKTWKKVSDAKISNVRCIRRTKEKGLSSAVIHGFRNAKYSNLLLIDADGQHNPEIIKEMLNLMPKNDFVIGSRFIKGGSVDDWQKPRILISKAAACLAKPLLSSKITDPMSGFFMTKKAIFNQIQEQLSGKGYKILLDIIVAYEIKNKILGNKQRVKIKEVPYTFKKRKKGESKLGFKVISDYLFMLAFLGFKKYSSLVKFLIVGLTGLILNTLLLWLLTEKVGIFYVLSGIIATETAIISNFILNNYWTWKKGNKTYSFIKRLLLYNSVSIIGLLITVSILWLLTELGIYYLLSNIIGIVIATAWNFLANDRITFKIK